MQIALTDLVEVQHYDPFQQGAQSYLGQLDVEVGFAGKKSTDVPYDQDELAAAFTQVRLTSEKPSSAITDTLRTFATRYLRLANNSSWTLEPFPCA